MSKTTDALGVEIRTGDTVMVTSWGAQVRLMDTGKNVKVLGLTPRGKVRLSALANPYESVAMGRSVHGHFLSVLRRDGRPGFEGNKEIQ